MHSCGQFICGLSVLQDEEPFNPDYVEVDRILDESHSVDKDNGEVSIYQPQTQFSNVKLLYNKPLKHKFVYSL